ncbi:MAG TPA: hypothetical protein VFR70_07945 [Flavobacterium sp.]|nr:hypothetical protein [Flavobacterium sp.]
MKLILASVVFIRNNYQLRINQLSSFQNFSSKVKEKFLLVCDFIRYFNKTEEASFKFSFFQEFLYRLKGSFCVIIMDK